MPWIFYISTIYWAACLHQRYWAKTIFNNNCTLIVNAYVPRHVDCYCAQLICASLHVSSLWFCVCTSCDVAPHGMTTGHEPTSLPVPHAFQQRCPTCLPNRIKLPHLTPEASPVHMKTSDLAFQRGQRGTGHHSHRTSKQSMSSNSSVGKLASTLGLDDWAHLAMIASLHMPSASWHLLRAGQLVALCKARSGQGSQEG